LDAGFEASSIPAEIPVYLIKRSEAYVLALPESRTTLKNAVRFGPARTLDQNGYHLLARSITLAVPFRMHVMA